MNAPPDVVVAPGGGEQVTGRPGRDISLLAAREQITLTEYRLGPGERGPDPHVHHRHTDAFYVIDGELEFLLGPSRERVAVGAGGLVAAPSNVVHTFANGSGAEVSFLNIHTPDGGFAAFMRARRDGDEGATFDTADPPEDGGLPLDAAVVSRAGEGERLVRANRAALLKAALPELCFLEFEVDGPLGGPEPHRHAETVDCFYVLEGALEFEVEGSRAEAGPGTFVSVPPGLTHTFSHRGEGRARFLNVHAPDAGFAAFMRGA